MENENAKIETQIQIPMNEVVIKRNGEVGRKPKLTKESLLNFIAKYQTTSPYELAKLLTEKEGFEVSHMTVYRLLKQIPQTEIEATLKQLAESELKPYEMQKEVFLNIPEVQEYIRTLKTQKLSKIQFYKCINGLWHICTTLKLHPKALTIEKLPMLRDFVQNVEDGKIQTKVKAKAFIIAIREWYLYSVGISKEKLNKYIGSISPIVGKYAREKIPIEKREEFLLELQKYLAEKGMIEQYPIYLSLVTWLFYTGTRINASLNMEIKDITWYEDYAVAKVVDKGRHKLGREKWDKLIMDDLEKTIKYNLASRGNPQEGKLFPLTYANVTKTFNEVYKRIGLKFKSPNHIWRHTSAQELLDATNWNYDLVASILGWKDTRTLKACYGEMGDSVRIRTLKIAMGLEVQQKPKPFRFSIKPIETFFLPSL